MNKIITVLSSVALTLLIVLIASVIYFGLSCTVWSTTNHEMILTSCRTNWLDFVPIIAPGA